jgi:hypothetical protein
MSEHSSQLPEAIASRLEAFRRKLWWMKAAEAVFAAFFGLLAGFLLVFLIERFVDTPVWARVVLLVCGTSLMAVFAPMWIHRWLWKHRRSDQLARLVRRAHPKFGDRLLGAVELATQDERQTALSPVLREAALRQIAAETEKRGTLEDSLPDSNHRRWGVVVAGLAAAVIGGFVFSPEAGYNSFLRWVHPLGHTPRYTFTQLEPLPERLVVARAEPFDLTLRLREETKRIPNEASVAVGGDLPFAVRLDGRKYDFRFDGLLGETNLKFDVGDASPSIRVEPMERPAVTKLQGDVGYPGYLGIPMETLSLEDGTLTLVEGSSVALRGRLTRDIAKATLTSLEGSDEELPTLVSQGRDFSTSKPIAAAPLIEPAEDAAPGTMAEGSRKVSLAFTDVEGLAAKKPFELSIRTVADAAPNVYLEGAEREAAILEDEVVEFRVIAGDDFGVRRIGFDWTVLSDTVPLTPDTPITGESVLGEGAAIARRLESPAVFSPELLKLGPQALRVRAWAEDYKPDRPRSYSEPIVVVILDRSQHAEMLRRRFGQIMDALEELSRREETDHEENRRLERLDAEQMKDPKNLERLAEQLEAEQKKPRRHGAPRRDGQGVVPRRAAQ